VASLFCQHFAPDLPGGRSWHEARDEVADHIIDTVTQYAPNFRASVLGSMALSPLGLEEKFGLLRGIFSMARCRWTSFFRRGRCWVWDYRGPLKGCICAGRDASGRWVTGYRAERGAEVLRDVKGWF